MFRKLYLLLALLLPLITLATGASADQCRRGFPPDGILPAAFCVDGDLPPGGRDYLTWALSKAQSGHPWLWSLRGPDGAVTRLEVYPNENTSGKPVYTLLDRAPLREENPRIVRVGEIDTIMLRPGRYSLVVSCDAPCTGKGDPYVLRVTASPFEGRIGYRREEPPDNKPRSAQPLPAFFSIDHANLEGGADTYAWTIGKQDAATCWQLFLLLPADEHGWMKLYDPDGHLFAQHVTGENPHGLFATGAGLAAFLDVGVGEGRYLIRVGPAKHRFTPYAMFSTVLGSRVMKPELAGSTLACPVLNGD